MSFVDFSWIPSFWEVLLNGDGKECSKAAKMPLDQSINPYPEWAGGNGSHTVETHNPYE